MKAVLTIAAAALFATAGCDGGDNAQDLGANVESSEAEVTAPTGGMPYTETVYGSRQNEGGTLATDGM